ncbi:hypothetical protein ABHF33_07275 [Chitinibacter sp. FCG-7]|uniref:P-type ATPase A domain-containing protein n=1 Tax=Chitinibacter mangrovi TaxID=3153927 RepID=A0AAU7FEM7_9NEIS
MIVSGQSSITKAPITGESLPIEKTIGDAVFAGTISAIGFVRIHSDSGGRRQHAGEDYSCD